MEKGVVTLSLCVLSTVLLCASHPLEDYVKRDDGRYSWREINRTQDENRTTVVVLNMTSQQWMDETFSDHPVWFHYIVIAYSDVIEVTDQSYVFTGLGELGDPAPDPETSTAAIVMRYCAFKGRGVVAYVSNIPNQPIALSDGVPRSEDALIARTWMSFVNMTEPKNPDMLLYFPMVKAMVKAMDAVTEFMLQERSGEVVLDKFVIGGPSKRGWTSWLTGATDDRIVGINPMVMSLLNMIVNMHHQYQSLGGWTWAFKDYYNEGLTAIIDGPEVTDLLLMQDPYEMRDNLTMPKYIIKAATDEFFMLDDLQFFLDDLPGTSNVLILENAIHVMEGHWKRMADTVIAWFISVHRGTDREYMNWTMSSDVVQAATVVTSFEPAVNVTGWMADTVADSGSASFTRRDFRWMRLYEENNFDAREESNVTWVETPVEDLGNNRYQLVVNAPPQGWTAFFIVATYPGPDPDTYVEVSTQPNVVPTTFGYPDCAGAECRGILV